VRPGGAQVKLLGLSQATTYALCQLLDPFAYSRELVNDELAEVRYRASVERTRRSLWRPRTGSSS
jgi:hypothetical protein